MHAFPTLLVLIAGCREQTLVPLSGAIDSGATDGGATDSGATATEAAAVISVAEDAAPTIVINELMAANDSTVMDELGQTDDWVELFNASDAAVDLTGWGLGGGDGDEPDWSVPSGHVLGAGERLLIWLDDAPEQGDLHAALNLDADGDALTLFAPHGAVGFDQNGAVERWSFDEQTGDVALARLPDGGANIDLTVYATPGNPNPWDPGLNKDPSELLFAQDRLDRFDIRLPEASLEALEADPYSWVEGSIGFEGVYLSPVGVHIKGAWGSLRELDQKFALKVKVNQYIDGQRLRGLQKLTFNNMVQDPSCVHERLAYQVFRDAGVPAPRTSHTEIYLNGEYRGLYAHVESEDDVFLERWFGDGKGNLYEGAYGPDFTSYTSLDLDQDGAAGPEPV